MMNLYIAFLQALRFALNSNTKIYLYGYI